MSAEVVVKSRKYFFDLDAVRVPHKSLRGQGRSLRAQEGRTSHTQRHLLGLRKSGAGYVGHVAGKNPGDVLQTAANSGANNKAPYIENNPHFARLAGVRDALHPAGKNPGDVFEAGKRRGTPYRRNNLHLSQTLYDRDANHPSGKNPGDVVACSPETRRLAKLCGTRAAKMPFGSGWVGHPPGGMARIVRDRDERWLSPGGKNPGDFWTLGTRPFREAHFAVYPEALCETPIKAACPQLACKKCGRPRQRVSRRVGYAGRIRKDNGHYRHVPGFSLHEKRSAWGEKPVYVTKGWTSSKCKAGFEPGVVLDPFAGAGTTLVVAKKLGRSYLGCDLNPDYVKIARRRLARC